VLAQERGFLGGELRGERPPPSALAGRPSVRMAMEEGKAMGEKKRKKNFAGWVWGVMGGKEDREKEEDKVVEVVSGEGEKGEENVSPAAGGI